MKKLLLILVSFTSFFSAFIWAEVKLPQLLSDGLVLQRDTENKIWGWAANNEKVTIILDGKTIASSTTKNNAWQVGLPPQTAGGPHKITVVGKDNDIKYINDVYFGDVWVASGQSNMQTTLSRIEEMFPDAIPTANSPLVREFTVPRIMNFKAPQQDLSGGAWEPSTPDKIADHSAVAYFFGKKIHETQKVPVGILGANFGGSPAECWISREALKQYPEEYKSIENFKDDAYLQSLQDADKKDSDAWYAQLNDNDEGSTSAVKWYENAYNDSNWQKINVPSVWENEGIEPMSGLVWFRKTIDLPENVADQPAFLRLGVIVDADIAYINGQQVGRTWYRYPPRRYKVEPGIVKPGKNVITLRVRVDNKQGEFVAEKPYYLEVGDTKVDLTGEWKYKISNVVTPPPAQRFIPYKQALGCYNGMLAPLFNMKIKGVIWYQGESNADRSEQYQELFPQLIQEWRDKWQQGNFPFLYVQLANYMTDPEEPSDGGWAKLRYAQFLTLQKAENTAMAVITDVGEWNDLHPLNKKAVGERLALTAQALAYGDRDIVYSGPLYKSLEREKNKLIISFDHVGDGLIAKHGKLGGFAIAGEDGEYVWAKAKIKKNKVIVWHKSIKKPVSVRYAWRNDPKNANLYNKNGLPASVFEASVD
ncbi:sialate O-acetylesterase [Alteromonadaceae bacterium 2753L.S.0a.02]|nr:sialate O-acetylesterase [Alteromonadaceae bacterium 2753L.S.0a.02]